MELEYVSQSRSPTQSERIVKQYQKENMANAPLNKMSLNKKLLKHLCSL